MYRNVIFIHPVHAVFRFANLEHDAVSIQRFVDLLDSLEIEHRYEIVNELASHVGLKPCKPQFELDLQLRRCRQFREASWRLEGNEQHTLRVWIEQIFNSLFLDIWKKTASQVLNTDESENGKLLSCKVEDFQRNMDELWKSKDPDIDIRIESLHRYMLFCEQVAGPLIGYC